MRLHLGQLPSEALLERHGLARYYRWAPLSRAPVPVHMCSSAIMCAPSSSTLYVLCDCSGIAAAVRTGNVALFNAAMEQHREYYIKVRAAPGPPQLQCERGRARCPPLPPLWLQEGVYLLLERLQMHVYRTLFKRVCVRGAVAVAAQCAVSHLAPPPLLPSPPAGWQRAHCWQGAGAPRDAPGRPRRVRRRHGGGRARVHRGQPREFDDGGGGAGQPSEFDDGGGWRMRGQDDWSWPGRLPPAGPRASSLRASLPLPPSHTQVFGKYIRGYVSHAPPVLVTAKERAFPPLTEVMRLQEGMGGLSGGLGGGAPASGPMLE